MEFFQGGPYPGLTDSGDAAKMHHAYDLFIQTLTQESVFKIKKTSCAI
jgi:hypothetical protein